MLKKAQLQKDAPWRTTNPNDKPIPRINRTPLLTIPQNPNSDYALSLIKHPDPIGGGFASEAKVEAAGPDCIVPGQVTPIKLLGLKVWPININLKFMEPVDRELKNMGKGPVKMVFILFLLIPILLKFLLLFLLSCGITGYNSQHKRYRCLATKTNRVYISRHVRFNESMFPFAQHQQQSPSVNAPNYVELDIVPLVTPVASLHASVSPSVNEDRFFVVLINDA